MILFVDDTTTAPVHTLGIGQKQLIEIIRATDKHSRVLVLDEARGERLDRLLGRVVRVLGPWCRRRHRRVT